VKRILSQAQEFGLENSEAILCKSKRISTACEAYEHLNNLFATEDWARGHADKTVGEYITVWRDSSTIERPRTNVDHGSCEHIRASRSFVATSCTGKGIVLIRPLDCWCAACLQIVGRGVGNMAGRDCKMLKRKLTQLEVEGCVGAGRGLANTFDERQVKPLPKGSMQERVEAEHLGRGLVLNKRGSWRLCWHSKCAEDEDDTFWVAQLVDSQQGNKAHPHIYERVTERHKQIEHEGVKVGLNRGEYAFTVRFLERDASDPNRMTFLPPSGPVRLVNSSELRAIKLKMDQATVMLDMPKRRSGSKAAHVVKDRLILTGESENEILRRCY
jgi:hypothetical protein